MKKKSRIANDVYLTIILAVTALYSNAQTKEVPIDYISNTPKKITSIMVGYNYGFSSENPLLISQGFDINFNNSNLKIGFSYDT
jgi:hypothetical protein